MIARRYIVSGRVQGVGYRYFVMHEAVALGVAGWARNLVDGSVEVLAAGEETLLHAFEGRLWQGPPHARVSGLEGEPAEPPDRAGFHILPTPW